MRQILLAGLCSMLLIACGYPSKSPSLIRAAAAGTPAVGVSEGPADKVSAGVPVEVKTAMEKLQSRDRNEQADAIIKLRYMKDGAAPAIPLLVRMLSSDVDFPQVKLMILSLSPKTSSCSSEPTFGGEAAETLARIGKTSDELLGELKDRRWQVRANAARALGGVEDARAIDPLMSLLSDKSERPVVKGNAALALALIGAPSAVDPLISLLKDKDQRVRAAAASALGRLHDPRAVRPLIATLGDENARVRQAVTGGLASLGGPLVLDPLVRALDDPHRQVREVAAAALGRTQDPRAVEPLLAALNDSYVNVQINAARALGSLQEPRALEPLIRLLNDEEIAVRTAAVEALGQMNDPLAVQPLIDLAYREENEVHLGGVLQSLAALSHAGGQEAWNRYRIHRPDWKQWWAQNKAELLRRK